MLCCCSTVNVYEQDLYWQNQRYQLNTIKLLIELAPAFGSCSSGKLEYICLLMVGLAIPAVCLGVLR